MPATFPFQLGALRRRLILLTLTIGAAFFIAHIVNAFLSQALQVPVTPQAITRTAAAENPPPHPSKLAEEILSAGIIPVVQAALPPTGGESGLGVLAPLPSMEISSKIKLLGTVLGDGITPRAVVEFLTDKRQTLYLLHEQIPNVGEIVEIRRDGIMVRQDDRQGFLPVFWTEPPSAAAAPAPMQAGPSARSNRVVIDRRQLTQSIADLPKLLSQAQATPYYENGKLEGWQVVHMAPQSLFGQLGLRQGDVLLRVNGVEVRDPGTMLAFFQQVKNENLVRVDLLRNRARQTLTYEIR